MGAIGMLNNKFLVSFVAALALLSGMRGAQGTVFPNQSTLTVAGRTFVDFTNFVVLHAHVVTAGRFTTFRTGNSTSGHQVSNTKVLTICACLAFSETASTSSAITLLYGDSDVGLDSASAQTNAVYAAGDSTLA